jgi:hypothetical protein
VKFGIGEVLEQLANVIAYYSYANVDTEGRRYILMDSIIDQMEMQAKLKDYGFFVINGKCIRRITFKGWKLYV